jgi:SAM-dependent methyltransferase
MSQKQYYFTLKNIWSRTKLEYNYYCKRPWSLGEVGEFWDTVRDYDDVNETLYTYFRRFTNSYDLAIKYLPRNDYKLLDMQARSGKGSLYWFNKKKISSAVCVDFSDYLKQLASDRLKKCNIEIESIKVLDFPLPFDDQSFDFVISYETIEHVYEYNKFVSELYRLLTDEGILILTCPNIAWEWVHWLTAIININHSEGPHRFLWRRSLIKAFKINNLEILEENTTILLPFNNKLSIFLDKVLEKVLPEFIRSRLALRRTFILKRK